MNDVIKEFLVGLGFDVDESSYAKFNKAIASASARVVGLYAAIKVLSAAVFYSISKISEGFEQMGYEFRIVAPAINKTLYLRQELLKAYRAAGINIQQVVRNAILFNFSITKTKYAFEAIYKSVASRFFPLLTKQLDVFRKNLYANMPRIQAGLERFIKFVFKAFEATVLLGQRIWSILQRVYDFFSKLDKATDGWSTIILGVLAAWNLLNLSFLATPLGALIAGLGALIVLLDDYKTWKEGGKSLFDWSAVAPQIEGIIGLFKSLFNVVIAVARVLRDLFAMDESGFYNDLLKLLSALNAINTAADKLARTFSSLRGVLDWRDSIDQAFLSGINGNPSAAIQAVNSPLLGASPLGSNPANSISNSIKQATTITVQGTAGSDPGAIGSSVAGQQTKVNYDLVKNLKGSAK